MITEIKNREPNAELVELLKGLLADAESGEIKSMFYVVYPQSLGTRYDWVISPGSDSTRLIGGVSLAQHDFITAAQLGSDTELSRALDI